MKGRTPRKYEKQHMDKVQQLGCIVCRKFHNVFSPAEIHHIGGKTAKNAHLYVLPLCYRHHREGHNNELFVSRHPYKREFQQRYGTEKELLREVNALLQLEPEEQQI